MEFKLKSTKCMSAQDVNEYVEGVIGEKIISSDPVERKIHDRLRETWRERLELTKRMAAMEAEDKKLVQALQENEADARACVSLVVSIEDDRRNEAMGLVDTARKAD